MGEPNYYQTLRVTSAATQAEVKQAYRRLVKEFHPDRNPDAQARDEMVRINTAYEVLGDRQARQSYDRRQGRYPQTASAGDRGCRHGSARQRSARQTATTADERIYRWVTQVYHPLNLELDRIIDALDEQIDELSGDPFDDELMGNFMDYISACQVVLERAQATFESQRNPSVLAGVAADLYHCLNQVGDGIEELEYFSLNYDDHHLHVGQELFRIARGLQLDALDRIGPLI
ncbi:J domain-containing protein [Sodalinema gerasimenkoae]|uniref:J domain-containing protein n=1 Tax=Sodalinema gerasimenkoae TaxID=2862348 RepID=UPI0013577E48|nr:J domain-containing protein [Sodalinema gerasimenkoae]